MARVSQLAANAAVEAVKDCDIDIVANEARDHKLKAAISNSFDLGGQNAVLVFSKVN
jgi:3-oxoacyl-(acyl-carrier-protein) synthase